MPGDKIPAGYRRCSAEKHKGERVLPESSFADDRAQPSGKRSHCKTCYNAWRNARNAADPEPERARARANHRASTAAADERDEEMLDKRAAEARRLVAEKERRLASDDLPLKAADFSADEDFDTGVANDERPGAGKLSGKAASEKRQEFNARMGEHARGLRGAAVAEERGSSRLEDAMSPEDGTYIGALAEQERRFSNRRLARSVSLFSAGEELARRLWVQACQQYLTGRVVPRGYATKPSTKKKRSVCVMLSDLHLGAELLAADNPQPFRKVEEARRLEYVLRQVLDYKPQYRKDSELVLMINGDVIEGLLLWDYRDGAPLTEQKVVFQRAMETFVAECARVYPKVRVFFQPGNHGRDKVRHPGRATSAKWDGHEWQMYYALMRACSDLKNVDWDLPFRAVGKIDLHGSWFLLSHGDTEVKLGDPDTKAKDNLAILDKINATRLYGVEFAAAGFGHFHKPRYLPYHPRVLFNGALLPPNGAARGAGYIGEAMGQWMWEATEGYPVGDLRFIEVGPSQDRDERLGKLIEPFRFDLE